MIKLFYAPGTCALAVHIVLEWIGFPYELERVQLGDPEYLKINLLGQVPAMIDGNSGVMNQADALLKYLAHRYPEAQLGSNGSLHDMYELDRWLAFFTGDVHPAFYPFFRPNRYSTDDSEIGLKLVKEASYKLIDRVFNYLDAHLEEKTYIIGNRRTIVDPYAFAMIRWATTLPHILCDYNNINRFYQKFREDDSVKQVMMQQGIQ